METLTYAHSSYTGTSLAQYTDEPAAIYQTQHHTLMALNDDFELLPVGTARIYEIYCVLADNHDMSLFEFFDSNSDFFEIYEQFESSPWPHAKSGFDSWLEVALAYPLVILDRLQISKPYRGKGIAKAFLNQVISTSELRGGSFMVLNAEPFELHDREQTKAEEEHQKELEIERKKLHRLYSTLGFKRLSKSSNVMYILPEV